MTVAEAQQNSEPTEPPPSDEQDESNKQEAKAEERDPMDFDFAGAVSNKTRGDVNGLQTGMVVGDVTINGPGLWRPDIVARREALDKFQAAAGDAVFVEPHGLDRGREMLHGDARVIVISGAGTGRSKAAGRLLYERGVKTVIHLNPRWPLESVREEDLEQDVGYIRMCMPDGNGLGFDEGEFRHLSGLMRSTNGYAILLVDTNLQVPSVARQWVVPLQPPPFFDVAAAIARARSDSPEEAIGLLKTDFAALLNERCSPSRAARAAELAIQVVNKTIRIDDALAEFQSDVAHSVANWFGGRPRYRTVEEYSSLLAVAVFPDRPFDLVFKAAQKLAEIIRAVELMEGKVQRPPKVFGMSRTDLEGLVNTRIESRPHPTYRGMLDETIGFVDANWARAVIRHVWLDFPGFHDKIIEWLADTCFSYDFFEDAASALSYILGEIPAHQPTLPVVELAQSRKARKQELAARTMSLLLLNEQVKDVYEKVALVWLEESTIVSQKCTMAKLCGTSYGQRRPQWALQHLRVLAGASNRSIKSAVVRSMTDLLVKIGNRPIVLEALSQWTKASPAQEPAEREHAAQRCDAALRSAIWILGLVRRGDNRFGASRLFVSHKPLSARDQGIVDQLVRRLLREDEFAPDVLAALFHLSTNDGRAADFRAVASAMAADAIVTSRHGLFTDLTRRYPRLEHGITALRRAVIELPADSADVGR